MINEEIIEFDLELYLTVLSSFGKFNNPALRIYKKISDPELIKKIAKKAIKNQSFIGKIQLKDSWKAASKLKKLNIITKEDFYESQNKENINEIINLKIYIRRAELDNPLLELEKLITDSKTMNYISKIALTNSYFISKIEIGNRQRAIDTFISLGYIKNNEL